MPCVRRLALLCLAPLLAGWGLAEHGIHDSSERGGSCTAMIPYYGPEQLWMASFAGGRGMDISAERVFTDWRVADTCFFTRPECERWLAGVKQGWPMEPGFAFCRPLAGRAPSGGAKGPLKR